MSHPPDTAAIVANFLSRYHADREAGAVQPLARYQAMFPGFEELIARELAKLERGVIAEEIPMNEGCLEPLNIVIPEGSLLSPAYPAAVVAGNVETSQCITDALFGALNALAASQGTMNNLSFGNDNFQYYETIAGGAGAGPGFHGADAVQTHMTNSPSRPRAATS